MDVSGGTMQADGEKPLVRLRSYQEEMLEASLARNIIVAMDTGSGKTPIATYRILAELERTDASQLVWFVAPKVALAQQQYRVISEQLPGYLVKILLGSDNVDKWTDQRLWDATLANVRVVVSTPAVLADALTHGFVAISRLSLLVFDEAHNCIGNSPMNRIMRNFYHPAKAGARKVPHVLGLSASPLISKKSASLETLEGSLDAIAKTPKQHRLDLDAYVHPPQAINIPYHPGSNGTTAPPQLLTALEHAIRTYSLSTDPYIVELQELVASGDNKAASRLQKVQLKRNPWCLQQMQTLLGRYEAVLKQLGDSAADWYLLECRRRFLDRQSDEALLFPDVSQKERAHLSWLLRQLPLPEKAADKIQLVLTHKVQALIDTLSKPNNVTSTKRVVIFAEQRAVVLAVGWLLRQQPGLATHYTFGTFLGTSVSSRRKVAVADLVDLRAQSQDFESFRSNGPVNALVATSVLEEGIDISACNLVICFDLPMNLVQFVQRRGRARQQGSKYIMLVSETSFDDTKRWSALEQKMKEYYQDESRQAGQMPEEDEEAGREYRVTSTGALLHLDNAKAHLFHFCEVSSRAVKYVDVRPDFLAEESIEQRWRATVTLPSFVHSSLRVARSAEHWSKEETAVKNAAFEAYVALHKAGLVNDNLLPHLQRPDPGQVHVDQPSIVTVAGQQSSLRGLCQAARSPGSTWRPWSVVLRRYDGSELLGCTISLPTLVDLTQCFTLYWNESTQYQIVLRQAIQGAEVPVGSTEAADCLYMTDYLLRSVYGSRMKPTSDPLPFLVRCEDLPQSEDHTESNAEHFDLLSNGQVPEDCGLAPIKGETGRAYFVSDTERSDCGAPLVVLTAFPKRRDFLHPLNTDAQHGAHTAKRTVPLDQCTVEGMPARYALFAAFVPSLLHRIDLAVLAADLQSDILSEVQVSNRDLIVEAISAPVSREPTDYNRLEFLGDAVLKFCTSLHVMAKHPTWPEGYLGQAKDRIVSNNALAKAALNLGLDKYIVTRPFTGAKWRPPYVDEVLATETGTRVISSKVLADVVEALIGAAFVDGGLKKAQVCIRILLPHEDWSPLENSISAIVAECVTSRSTELGLLERLVGHTFAKPELLIEALTHASFPHSTSGSSYERLEFLGDAVLDLIIVPQLFSHHRKPRHWDLHRMRDALVNGDFLAYCCMRHSVEEDCLEVDRGSLAIQQSRRTVRLHDFLRSGAEAMRAKREFIQQADVHMDRIGRCLQEDSQYPWPELVAFKSPKFFSDIVESTVAAIFLDSGGSLTACDAFLDGLGIFEEMHRILDSHVETAYPKEQLGILASTDKVCYTSTSHITDFGAVVFDCTVKVGDEDVATVHRYSSKEEAELRAARKATAMLSARPKNTEGKKRKLDIAMRDDDANPGANEVEVGDVSNIVAGL